MKQEQGFSLDGCPLWHLPKSTDSVLMQNLSYYALDGRVHTAIGGMLTDGMTNPRRFWRAGGAPYANDILRSCIIHDHYCWQARSLEPGQQREQLRLAGDELFREMVSFESGPKKGMLWFYFVRMGALSSKNKPACPSYIHQPKKFAEWAHADHEIIMQYHTLGAFLSR